MSEPLTLRERVALIDEFARLDRLLPDAWGWGMTCYLGSCEANAWGELAVPVIESGAQPTRLEALRALNDALAARQEVANLESGS